MDADFCAELLQLQDRIASSPIRRRRQLSIKCLRVAAVARRDGREHGPPAFGFGFCLIQGSAICSANAAPTDSSKTLISIGKNERIAFIASFNSRTRPGPQTRASSIGTLAMSLLGGRNSLRRQ
jgi:hypothetical protein